MSARPTKFFVVIEGLDGTGKSSIARAITQVLNQNGGAKLTFEPHDPSACGIFLRQVLMHRINAPLETLALAFATNRADHCNRDIGPFLQQANGAERVVICDRYYLSSMVYQSSETFSMENVLTLNASALKPDLTLFLNASDKTCYARMRNRAQSKELFETNLRKTRTKYLQAIALLRERGETIVEVAAEGGYQEVLNNAIEAIGSHSPDWLSKKVHPFLFVPEPSEYFEVNGITLADCAEKIKSSWCCGPLVGVAELRRRLSSINDSAKDFVGSLPFNALANIFLDMLKKEGFLIHDRLPWTDIDAVELSYRLPLNINQRGTAVLMGSSQRYDIILPNLLGDKFRTLESMSDFLFILDTNPNSLHSKHYERDLLQVDPKPQSSPAVSVVGLDVLSSSVALAALNDLLEEFTMTIQHQPGLKEVFHAQRERLKQVVSSCSCKGSCNGR
ncbi:MAG TPA: dTMP kinase [Candidatus Bathyarchaeia archaeon]|nr:dTMP kinase [Candidatus Bathyarchaeia archaeon]